MDQKNTLRFYKFLAFTTVLPYFSLVPFFPSSIVGFNYTGWAWIIMFIISIVELTRQPRITMPYKFWIPWMVYILVYNIFSFSFIGLQSSLQYICFVITGLAASTFYYSEDILWTLFQIFKKLTIFIIIMGIWPQFYSGYVSYGPIITMTAIFMGIFYLSLYFVLRRKSPLIPYLLLLSVPVVHVARMPAFTMLAVGMMHFANKRITSKILFFAMFCVIGSTIFLLPSFQKKMFFSQSGTIEELMSDDNRNLNTSGRNALKLAMIDGLDEKPILGHGPRAELSAIQGEGIENITEAHNDYLAVLYNYGYVGLAFLLFGLIGQFFQLFLLRKRLPEPMHQILCYTALTVFIAWGLLMYTDNIMKYAVFIGNFHFAMIGILYSLLKSNAHQGNRYELQ